MSDLCAIQNEHDRFTGDKTIRRVLVEGSGRDPTIEFSASIFGETHGPIAGDVLCILSLTWPDSAFAPSFLGIRPGEGDLPAEEIPVNWLLDGCHADMGRHQRIRTGTEFEQPSTSVVVSPQMTALRRLAESNHVEYRVVSEEFTFPPPALARLREVVALLRERQTTEERIELQAAQREGGTMAIAWIGGLIALGAILTIASVIR